MTQLDRGPSALTASIADDSLLPDGGLSDGLRQVADAAKEFAEQLRASSTELDGELVAKRLMPALGAAGLVGTTVPKAFGGQGLGCRHNVVIQEELAAVAPSLAVLRAVSAIFVAQPLQHFGSDQQTQRWLPGIGDGTITASLAVTEPEAGSDALSMTTRAETVGDGYELTGTKHFICSPAEAAFILVYAVTDPDAPKSRRLSAFLVPTDAPGVRLSSKIDTLGVRGVNHAAVHFDRVPLDPDEHRLGNEGQGVEILQYGLIPERIDIAARAVGCARGALREATDHANTREQFGRPLHKFQAVSHRIANMATKVHAASLLTMNAAAQFDQGIHCARDAAMAKLFAAEEGFSVCDDALQILASKGYAVGQSPVEMLLRDIRVLRMAGGTDDIMRHIIQADIFSA